jgi:hypothetical protein
MIYFFSNAKARINTHNGDVLHKEARVINLIHTCHGIHKHENVDFVALMVISFKIHSLFINKCKYEWQPSKAKMFFSLLVIYKKNCKESKRWFFPPYFF